MEMSVFRRILAKLFLLIPYYSGVRSYMDANPEALLQKTIPNLMSNAQFSEDFSGVPEASAYSNICDLIREKTRFEPGEVEKVSEVEEEQDFILEVRYELDAKIEQLDITGLFGRKASDHECRSPLGEAQKELPGRLNVAALRIKAALEQADGRYDGIAEGLLLQHDCKHWELHDCYGCKGDGRVQCYTCYGKKKERCWHCSGSLRIPCDAMGCVNGRHLCNSCHGTGQVSHQVSYQITVQVPTTTWNNGVSSTSYHNEYRTEYRSEMRACTAYGCSYGYIQCSRCYGMGTINCTTCGATGEVSCRTCGGVGDLRCEPCSGSGRLGNAAWVDVYAKPTYRLQLPDGSQEDALAIVEREGAHGIAMLSTRIFLAELRQDDYGSPNVLTAIYRGTLRISRLATRCAEQDYNLVAYGRDLRWLTTDAMVETLLRADLQALQTVLDESVDDGLLSSQVDHLLLPLRHVTTSELNAELVEVALGQEEAPLTHKTVVSAEYAHEIQKSILGALKQIYTRLAKPFCWQTALASLVVSLALWALTAPVWALVGGLGAVAGGGFLFTRKVRRILSDALGSRELAVRAMAIAHKSRRSYTAYSLIVIPGAICAIVLGSTLPTRGLLSTNTPLSASNKPKSSLQPSAVAQPVSVVAALESYKQGNLESAFKEFKQLAEQNIPDAFGPYGWMILNREGLGSSTNVTAENRHLIAKPWIDKGLAQNNVWAKAGQGYMLVQALGVERDMIKGIQLLEEAASASHVRAMHDLGMIYVNGYHVPVDYSKARKWFTQAADLGRAPDIYYLGLMDWYGHGIKQANRKQALERWSQAAKLGEPAAKEALAKGHP